MKFLWFILSALLAMQFFACSSETDENYDPTKYIITRKGWNALDPKEDLSLHTDHGFAEPVRILVGHFGFTCHEDPIGAMLNVQIEKMNAGQSDTPYNCALSYPCEKLPEVSCLEGRCKESMPAMYLGHNAGSYGVGIIGNTLELDINDKVVNAWGKQFGRIAQQLGFKKLERGEKGNIVAQCELPNLAENKKESKYPVCPSPAFMARFDEMIVIANKWLTDHTD